MQANADLIAQRIRLRSQFIRDTLTQRYRAPFCLLCWQTNIQRPTITGSCLHQFCFRCLANWISVRCAVAVEVLCPLCARSFQTVLYDIQGPYRYREVQVQCFKPAAPSQRQQQPAGRVVSRSDVMWCQPSWTSD